MRLRSSLALLLVLAAGACHSWRAQPGPAPEAVARLNGTGTVRVIRNDQSVMMLRSPQVVGDSIIGSAGDPPQRASVALADVQRIEARRVNAAKTGGLAVGTVLVGTLVLVAAVTVAVLTSWN